MVSLAQSTRVHGAARLAAIAGLGAITLSQIGSVLSGLGSDLAGFAAAEIIFHLICDLHPHG